MRTTYIATLAFLFGLAAAPALAQDTPQSLYDKGDYAAAVAAGEAKGDAVSLTIATRAALSEEKLKDTPCLECFRKVEALAQRAIDADPKKPDAYIYLASAMGFENHIIGTVAASSAGLPSKSKKAIDTALSIAPNDPLVLAGLGGWNIEIVRGGGMFGRWLYDASFDAGVKAFNQAIALAPNDVIIRYEYALQLAAYDAKGQRAQIAAQLTAVASAPAPTAYEQALQARAKHLSDLLAKNDMAGFAAQVKRYQDYPH
jgi:tetratricopeptide (TPR) repeat protein